MTGATPSFLSELKRRKVWRVAAGYSATALATALAVSELYDDLGLPEGTPRVVIILLAVGFPVALVLAWLFDVTPGAVKATPATANRVTDGPSVVVLPFRARESDEIEQLTAEGLTDDITTLLTMVKGVKVAPRQSVIRTLGPNDDALQIVRDLGGRYAVTGSVRRDANKLRISTELTEIGSKEQKWSQKFDRSTDDLFAIQDEIASGVVGSLGGVITHIESARALRQHPDNLQAWELTRRALSIAWDWRPETLRQGMLDVRRAIELDPNYALAHGLLAMILSWRAVSAWTNEVEAEGDEALREADKAARLGYDNAEALWLAINAYWAAAPHRSVELYERSVARQPGIFLAAPFALAHAGVAYAKVGREEEGLALIKQFRDTFPNDEYGAVWTRVFVGYAELCRRNYTLVADVLMNTASEHDGMCRVIALMNSDQQQEAIAEFKRWQAANPAINLDHYIDYFKDYHVDKTVGAELSDALARLKAVLAD